MLEMLKDFSLQEKRQTYVGITVASKLTNK
jgi:hypothetical protein